LLTSTSREEQKGFQGEAELGGRKLESTRKVEGDGETVARKGIKIYSGTRKPSLYLASLQSSLDLPIEKKSI
jgi:hypothetical protein